jgi:molybdopterin-guanine dinucleotide biosynthesis protein A
MSHSSYGHASVVGAILVGEKGLAPLCGKPLISYVIECLAPQVETLILCVSANSATYASFGLPMVVEDSAKPLAGVLSAMRWAAAHCPMARWVATSSDNTPFLPQNCVEMLHQTAASSRTTYAGAMSANGIHYESGLWAKSCLDDLAAFVAEDKHEIQLWAEQHWHVNVLFSPENEGDDPFFAVRTPEDMQVAERRLRSSVP